MKTAVLIVRVLIGVIFITTSIGFFLNIFPEPVVNGDFKAFQVGLVASPYIVPMAKTIELLCGLSFLTGRFVTLANLVILPLTINILFINFYLAPQFLPLGIFIFLGNIFLIYSHWENYNSLFVAKTII